MRTLVHLGVLVATVCFCLPSALAQMPGMPGGSAKIEIAEARGLDSVPASPGAGFEAGQAGPVFAATTKAVAVRFQAKQLLSLPALSVVVTYMPSSGAADEILRQSVTAEQLQAGYAVLITNGNQPLMTGRYQASVVGENARLVRSIEFSVAAPRAVQTPEATENPSGTNDTDEHKSANSTYSVGGLEFQYSPDYTVVPVSGGSEQLVFFNRVQPFPPKGMLIVGVKSAGQFNPDAETRALVGRMVRFADKDGLVEEQRFADLGRQDVAAYQATGKMASGLIPANLRYSMSVYFTRIGGKPVMLGFVTFSFAAIKGVVPIDTQADTERTLEDFYTVVQSIRVKKTAASGK